ncbi:MAG: Gfo/Idh/MocA family oxidoreductase [Verrucomicrobium sp.]|nr:Gfo/Idh/MocA family oxidoreductase [Verrucomicrobium sp.]
MNIFSGRAVPKETAVEKVAVGVVGVGHIGRHHVRLYAEAPGADLVGVFDMNRDAARKIAAQYKVPAYDRLEDLLARAEALSVATPTVTHFEIGAQALEAGRHLLIEKPIADRPEQARQLVEIAARKGAVLQVGHIERFNPAFQALEAMLTHPKFIEAHRLSPYPGRSIDIGVVLDLMIHDIDIILHLVRSPLESIDAVGVPVLSRSEDIANARLRFQNGCVANITTSRISPEKLRKIRVFQDDAYLSLDYQNQSGEIYRRQDGKITRDKIPVRKEEPLKLELESFLECVRAKRRPLVDGAQAADALEVALRIVEQIGSGNGMPALP